MSLSEKVQQLNREIGATVERALSDLRREVSERLRASSDEVLRRIEELAPELPGSFLRHEDFAPVSEELSATARRSAFGELRDALSAVDRARSQSEILTALLSEAGRYASRAALLLTRPGEIRGWAGRGFGDADAALSNVAVDTSSNGSWGRLAQGQGTVRLSAADCAELCSRLEAPLPREGVLVPLVLRDRVAAALYADRLGDDALAVEALQILTYTAAQAIESLPFRERASTPTLALEDETPAGQGGAEPAASAAAAAPAPAEVPEESAAAPPPVEEPAQPETGASQVGATQALESAPQAEVEAQEVQEIEVEAEPEPWTVEPEPWRTEPAAMVAEPSPSESWAAPASNRTEQLPSLRDEEQVAAPAGFAGGMEAEVPRYPRSVEPEPAAPVAFSGTSPEATVLLQRPNLQAAAPAPEPPPLRPVAPPATVETAASSFDALRTAPLGAAGTPEVRPPSGVDGPGWAFATTRVPVSPSDETLHEEARRLARLLVSEIKLYNEEQVEEGRRNRDIYERLKEDIDRSRQMYEERVDPRILRSTDYFYQELVRILAAGDSRALGI
ncbi:MAG TPA: hypothetical protein VE685_10270 [Thermoanaerobaculia bacterium]|nr:hypothetical protein [Thermoanaerobaculia bacterium]